MGSLKTLALAGAMAVSVSAIARAADFPAAAPPPSPMPELRGTISSGIYLRGDIGVGVTNYGDYRQQEVSQAGGTFIAKEDSSTTFFGGGGIGYRFNNWFRVDGTLEYRGGATVGATDVVFNPFIGGNQTNTYKGNLSSIVALFNAYVDLGTWNCLTPYIGAGIGYASNRITGLTDQGLQFTGARRRQIRGGLGADGRCRLRGEQEPHPRSGLSLSQSRRCPVGPPAQRLPERDLFAGEGEGHRQPRFPHRHALEFR
jgi:opacity protein-like surface antigen